jgi:ATP-dependent helicase/DNAse subunit B
VKDKFQAVWVSHSSISDFLACPRAYFLNNVYKDPATGNKIGIITPPLAMGQVVHDVLESLSLKPAQERFIKPLAYALELSWKKIHGLLGGFSDEATEQEYKETALQLLEKVEQDPGPLKELAVKIKDNLPNYWLSQEEEIILCGRIDWLWYKPDTDSVTIIDFKTGKYQEHEGSLQLPIYYLLASNCQNRPVVGAYYWYLRENAGLTELQLPNLEDAHKAVLEVARKIKLARKLNRMKCPQNGCRACTPLERIIAGEGTFVGTNDMRKDMYILKKVDNSTVVLH